MFGKTPKEYRSRGGRWTAFLTLWVLVLVVVLFLAGKWALGWVLSSFSEETTEEPPPVVLDPEPVTPPLSFKGFNPARIIEDEQFFDQDAYSLEQVEAFIRKWNAGCRLGADDTPCLADYVAQTPSFEADQYCEGGFEGDRKSVV